MFNSKKTRKDELAFWLADAVDILEHQLCIIKRFKDTVDIMKTDLIADKINKIKDKINKIKDKIN